MKAFLALAATAWFGAGGGAVFDDTLPGFWIAWVAVGTLLAAIAVHQHTRKDA